MDPQIQIIFQLILAALLGGIIGLERKYKKREAGPQTYSLVSLGACLFTIIAFEFFSLLKGQVGIGFDPSRIIQAVAIGIGFLGAGIIFRREFSIEGLTTAAGLWTMAAIGIAIGAKFYFLAISGTILAIGILVGLGLLERKFFGKD